MRKVFFLITVLFIFVLLVHMQAYAAPSPKFKLACVTANIGQDAEDYFNLTAEISYQKNISVSDPSEVFGIWADTHISEEGYKFGAYCKNEWIMVSCTQANEGEVDEAPVDIDIKQDISCARDTAILHDPASLYITCCTIK